MKKQLRGIFIYWVCVLSAAMIMTVFISDIARDVFGFWKKGEEATVTIPENADTAQVSELLREKMLIKYPLIYRIYSRLRGDDGKYPQGDYTLNGSLCYDGIRLALKPKRGAREQIKLTIPEGSRIDEMIELFISNGIGTEKGFSEAINSFDYGFDFLSGLDAENKKYRLEGYLFPDTYYFYKDSTETEAVYKMLLNFDSKFNSEMRKRAQETGLDINKTVILASIIEKEAYLKSDMTKISSVFLNRLSSKSMRRLESDATTVYARGILTGEYAGAPGEDDLSSQSPFNTYKSEGLPPGAICSPGLDAIEAALYPVKTKYYYFVSDKNGAAIFSETYTEHLRAIAKIRKENGK